MRDWGLVYERPPMGMDVALFIAALLLHLPLTMLHMKAPQKGGHAAKSRLITNIDYYEQKARERRQAPKMAPPAVDAQKLKAEAQAKIKAALLQKKPPKVEPPKPKIDPQLAMKELNPAMIQKLQQKQLEQNVLKPLDSKKFKEMTPQLNATVNPNLLKPTGGVTSIQFGKKAPLPGVPAGGGLKGRDGFAGAGAAPAAAGLSAKSLAGIGGGDGGGPSIALPTRAGPANANILSNVAVSKGSFAGGGGPGTGGGAPVAAGQGIVLGPGGGGPISTPGRPAGGPAAGPLPVVTGKGSFSGKPSDAGASPVGTGLGGALPVGTPIVRKTMAKPRDMFQITGPLANRKIVSQRLPPFPDWLRDTSSVVLNFTVSPEGAVRPSIAVRRSSGNLRLDQIAIDALRQWVFAPLTDNYQDQTGDITFTFSIR